MIGPSLFAVKDGFVLWGENYHEAKTINSHITPCMQGHRNRTFIKVKDFDNTFSFFVMGKRRFLRMHVIAAAI